MSRLRASILLSAAAAFGLFTGSFGGAIFEAVKAREDKINKLHTTMNADKRHKGTYHSKDLARSAEALARPGDGQKVPGSTFCKPKSTLPSPVVTFCDGKWPNKDSKKMWFVLFTGEHCPSCKQVEPGWVELAEETDHEKFLGLAHIDCQIGNHKKKICDNEDIKHFPSMKMIFGGIKREFRGDQNADAYKGFVQQMINHFYVCPPGKFYDETRDAVVPLCAKRYPHGESQHDWLIMFYNQTGPEADMTHEIANEVAIDLGNNPVIHTDEKDNLRQKEAKRKDHTPMKRRDRLMKLQLKYKFKIEFPDKGPFGSEPFVRIGAICCDCDEDFPDFCSEVVDENLKFPIAMWNVKGEAQEQRTIESKKGFMEMALEKAGYYSGGDAKTEL